MAKNFFLACNVTHLGYKEGGRALSFLLIIRRTFHASVKASPTSLLDVFPPTSKAEQIISTMCGICLLFSSSSTSKVSRNHQKTFQFKHLIVNSHYFAPFCRTSATFPGDFYPI